MRSGTEAPLVPGKSYSYQLTIGPTVLSTFIPIMPSSSKPSTSTSGKSASSAQKALRDQLPSSEKEVLRKICPRGYGSSLERTLKLVKVRKRGALLKLFIQILL